MGVHLADEKWLLLDNFDEGTTYGEECPTFAILFCDTVAVSLKGYGIFVDCDIASKIDRKPSTKQQQVVLFLI